MQKLNKKDATLFDRSLDLFSKQRYQQSLKLIRLLLKKKPQHAECLAVEALNLVKLNNHEEALTKMSTAIELNDSSKLCLHVAAIVHREKRDYQRSLYFYQKALHNALEEDLENLLYDKTFVLAQVQDYAELKTTCASLCRLNAKNETYHIALAHAAYLNQDYSLAIQTLKMILNTFTIEERTNARVLTLLISLLLQLGDSSTADAYLSKYEQMILPKETLFRLRAMVFESKGLYRDAFYTRLVLLRKNPSCKTYLEDCISCIQHVFDMSNLKSVIQFFDVLKQNLSSEAFMFSIHSLQYLTTEPQIFKEITMQILEMANSRNIMLFPLIQDLLEQRKQLVCLVKDCVHEYLNNLQTTKMHPTKFLNALVFQSCCYETEGDLNSALQKIDEAICHSPTLPDLYVLRAKLVFKLGHLEKSLTDLSIAHELNYADQPIAIELAKTLLKLDKNQDAYEVLARFTKDEFNGVIGYLRSVECLWFFVEDGESLERQGIYHTALKRFYTVLEILEDHDTERFELYPECSERLLYEEYDSLVNMCNKLWDSEEYLLAVGGALRILLKVNDTPNSKYGKDQAYFESLSDAEKYTFEKKCLSDAKRNFVTEEKRTILKESGNEVNSYTVDKDHDGTMLIRSKHPLRIALRFLKRINWESVDINHCVRKLGTAVYERLGFHQKAAFLAPMNNINKL
ncbi:NatA N-acetyltransferase complex subunit [Schizosaccharomyces japonicus yFS275]|uniref:NatA N-acetyltransferase complex subunit n=1 Tax=Schizosaccharomyces japonicus (strain yFS275 / FY16936) TaxID=402676 RepID=B6K651_SCHJY|nr:NatA N-acetyltransferase complex subunit [Schizosaccharomyces japonicus yFS275]EEB09005.2 NatA N-acetyltransferase complex subunit [Schizosaccharomyces japonicus yFS275]